MRLGSFEMLHVPGHCAGHVVIRLHNILFSGDHVLGRISPHQSPERLTLYTGLGHYLDSLNLLEKWAGGSPLTLAGHDDPIPNLPMRLVEIRRGHAARLQLILEFLAEPHTIADVSEQLFGSVNGYNTLLAIEEAGAHVEYLHQRGLLRIVNVDELEANDGPVVTRYRRINAPVAKQVI
jgi:glyoxylase-like metal-dependent hydrolase (beta-lactamase superfamily II)